MRAARRDRLSGAAALRLYSGKYETATAFMSDNAHRDGRPSAPRSLASYIDPAWRARSRSDAGIRRALAGLLGAFLEQRRVDLSIAGHTLLVACHDSACATELRFLQRDLQKTLNASGYPAIAQVRVLRAQPMAQPAPPTASLEQRAIPANARHLLKAVAEGMDCSDTDERRLVAALLRLADAGLGASSR